MRFRSNPHRIDEDQLRPGVSLKWPRPALTDRLLDLSEIGTAGGSLYWRKKRELNSLLRIRSVTSPFDSTQKPFIAPYRAGQQRSLLATQFCPHCSLRQQKPHNDARPYHRHDARLAMEPRSCNHLRCPKSPALWAAPVRTHLARCRLRFLSCNYRRFP